MWWYAELRWWFNWCSDRELNLTAVNRTMHFGSCICRHDSLIVTRSSNYNLQCRAQKPRFRRKRNLIDSSDSSDVSKTWERTKAQALLARIPLKPIFFVIAQENLITINHKQIGERNRIDAVIPSAFGTHTTRDSIRPIPGQFVHSRSARAWTKSTNVQ